jgi:hypothetical protein
MPHIADPLSAAAALSLATSWDASARNGMRFDNHYCWVTRFQRIFFGGAYLEVDGERFDANGIRQLYESDTYPLGRRA